MNPGTSNAQLDRLLDFVAARTGLTFPSNRQQSIETALDRVMKQAQLDDIESYHAWVEKEPAAFDDLMDVLTIGETYFFRDDAALDEIGNLVPKLLRQRPPDHTLRLWSAGCASGEEPYSLAILLDELGLGERTSILATDVSRDALRRAREATYRDWSLRGMGRRRAGPYLDAVGDKHVLKQWLRERVRFGHLNLATDPYPSFANATFAMDFILCRNVLIYFDPATIAAVAQRFHECLSPGGYVLTAPSDPPLEELAGFELDVNQGGLFYRKKGIGEPSGQHRVRRFAPMPSSNRFKPVSPLPAPADARGVDDRIPPQPAVETEREALAPDTEGKRERFLEPIERAIDALEEGAYARAAELTAPLLDLEEACSIHARAIANSAGTEAAEQMVRKALERHGLSTELNYLHAVLLMELGDHSRAITSARRCLYLDRSLAIGHFTLAALLRSQGDLAGARRAYRNARDLAAEMPADADLPLGDGELAGGLAKAAHAQLQTLSERSDP